MIWGRTTSSWLDSGTPLLDDISPATVKREIRVRQMLRERVLSAVTAYNISPVAADLLMQMLQHDRHARPTIKEALKHPFNTDGYELERKLSSVERDQAAEMLAKLPDTVREVMQEPMLKRVARLIMVHVSEVSEAASLAFRMLDLHGYGELSISALEDNQKVFSDGRLPDDLGEIFEAMDLNRDGYISYRAFLAVTLSDDIRCDSNILGVTFRILDTDKDGFIGHTDLAKVFGHGPDSEVCSLTISEVSPDSKVSWQSFMQLLAPELIVANALLQHCMQLAATKADKRTC